MAFLPLMAQPSPIIKFLQNLGDLLHLGRHRLPFLDVTQAPIDYYTPSPYTPAPYKAKPPAPKPNPEGRSKADAEAWYAYYGYYPTWYTTAYVYPYYGAYYYGKKKRSADAEPAPMPNPEGRSKADAEAWYAYYGYYPTWYTGYYYPYGGYYYYGRKKRSPE